MKNINPDSALLPLWQYSYSPLMFLFWFYWVKWQKQHYHPICWGQSTESRRQRTRLVTEQSRISKIWTHVFRTPSYLLVHDAGQLPGQVPVVGLHLIMILLLVLFDQALVHSQPLTAGVHELPVEKRDGVQKSERDAGGEPSSGADRNPQTSVCVMKVKELVKVQWRPGVTWSTEDLLLL